MNKDRDFGQRLAPEKTEQGDGRAGNRDKHERDKRDERDKQEGLGKSVGLVMLLSTVARILSLSGSILYTTHFGYTLETDIYSYAVNLPNLIFTCLGTALVTVVIPIFAGRLAAGEKKSAYEFIDSILTIALVLAGLISLLGIMFSPAIVRLVGRFDAGDRSLAIFALRLMFPIMVFHAVNYAFQGVLQTNKRFVMPAIVSAFSGLSVILYVLLLADRFGIRGLLAATFCGLMLQALVLIPPVRNIGYRYHIKMDLQNSDVRLAGRLAIPVLVSSSSYQFNMFINSTFAAAFVGGVITITNMQTLAFTAAQLFILSTLAVYFPKMSAQYAIEDYTGYRKTFSDVMRLIIFFAVPASAGLAFLSQDLIRLLYGRGRVTEADLAVSAAVFSLYALAIASIGFKEAADRAFYAMRDSKTPAAVGMLIMVVNITLSFVLKSFLGLIGLAAAYLISITGGALILLYVLKKREREQKPGQGLGQHQGLEQKQGEESEQQQGQEKGLERERKKVWQGGMVSLLLKCFLSCAGMLAALLAADRLLSGIWAARAGLGSFVHIVVLTLLGVTVYFVLTILLKVEEAEKIKKMLLHALNRR